MNANQFEQFLIKEKAPHEFQQMMDWLALAADITRPMPDNIELENYKLDEEDAEDENRDDEL